VRERSDPIVDVLVRIVRAVHRRDVRSDSGGSKPRSRRIYIEGRSIPDDRLDETVDAIVEELFRDRELDERSTPNNDNP
jgi:hypothetical protein